MHLLAQDRRLQEELVMNLIQAERILPHLLNGRNGWGSISINRSGGYCFEVDSGQQRGQRNGGVQQLQMR